MAHGGGNGPSAIDIYGGTRGKVPFTHQLHQTRLEDCNVCHNMFPQEHDALKALKAKKVLKKKQVMNKLCISCHRKEKKAGRKYGPVKCSTCHKK